MNKIKNDLALNIKDVNLNVLHFLEALANKEQNDIGIDSNDSKAMNELGEIFITKKDDFINKFPKKTSVMKAGYSFKDENLTGIGNILVAFKPDNNIVVRKDVRCFSKAPIEDNKDIYSVIYIAEINFDDNEIKYRDEALETFENYQEYSKNKDGRELIGTIDDMDGNCSTHIIKSPKLNGYLRNEMQKYRASLDELTRIEENDDFLTRFCIGK